MWNFLQRKTVFGAILLDFMRVHFWIMENHIFDFGDPFFEKKSVFFKLNLQLLCFWGRLNSWFVSFGQRKIMDVACISQNWARMIACNWFYWGFAGRCDGNEANFHRFSGPALKKKCVLWRFSWLFTWQIDDRILLLHRFGKRIKRFAVTETLFFFLYWRF